ncbi:MAG: F0F1 ATP synthase subunit B [Patescibacteria group bacterium]
MEALTTLGIDFKVLAAQVVNFGILLFVLTKLLYHPILKAMDERRQRIAESLVKAEEIDRNAAAAEQELTAKRSQAKGEAAKIIDEAKATGEKDREQIVLSAETEAERLKNSAREQMEIERQGLYDETKKRVGRLALLVVTRSLQQDLGEEFYEHNINKALKEIEAA